MKIKIIENTAVAMCVVASCILSVYSSDANFVLVFSMFIVSACMLTYTLIKQKQYAVARLQGFFIFINVFALVKELV